MSAKDRSEDRSDHPPGRLGLPGGVLATVLLLHLLPFATRPALIGGDEPHYALMAHSMAVDGDVDLVDDYQEVAAGSRIAGRKRAGQTLDRHLVSVGGREVFSHPLGLPLLTVPPIWVQHLVAPGAAPDLLLGLLTLTITGTALLAGYRLLWRWIGDARVAALAAFGAYFSSPLWFYSRTYFTEPFTWSFAVLAMAAIAGGHLVLAAILLGLTLAMKETALLLVVGILGGALWRYGLGVASRLAIGPLAFGVLFMLKNLALVGEPLATFQPYRIGKPVEGIIGLLVDPTRGLLWFAPLLLLGSVIAWTTARKARSAPALLAGGVFLAYFLVSAAWVDWRGGSGFGPRLLVPGLAALALPLAWSIKRFAVRGWARLTLIVLFLAGFTVQWCAATDPVPAFWSIGLGELLADAGWRVVLGPLLGFGLLALLERMVQSASFSTG